MAVFGTSGVAVAVSVPASFALVAALLAFGSAGAQASVVAPAAGHDPKTASVVPLAGPTSGVVTDTSDWSVSRQLVRSPGPALPAPFRIATDDPVVFITIDDGVVKDRRGLRYVEAARIPVTAFITTWTVKESASYFARITRWGSIQNHSATHASVARSTTDLEHEICYTQRSLARTFGTRPWLMRPPYGEGAHRMEVQATARRCGIEELVMWNAVVDNGRLSRPGRVLRSGDIILLHFTRHLERDLRTAVRAARKAGLTPANLAVYLPATPSSPA